MADFVPVAEADTKEFVPVEEVNPEPFVPVAEVTSNLGDFMRQPDAGVSTSSPVTQGALPKVRQGLETQFPKTEEETIQAQVPPGDEPLRIGEKPAILPRFGKEGGLARSFSDVISGIGEWALNKPEEAVATLTPLGPAIAARYAPEMAQQWGENLLKGLKGDRKALNDAIAIATVVGLPIGAKKAIDIWRMNGPSRVQSQSPESIALEATKPPAILPEAQAELNKIPGGKNAVQERSAEALPLENAPEDGGKVGARVPEPETPSLPQIEREQQPQPAAPEVSPVRDVAPEFTPVKEVIPDEAKTQEKGQEGLLAQDLPPKPAAETEVQQPAATIESTPAGKVEPAGDNAFFERPEVVAEKIVPWGETAAIDPEKAYALGPTEYRQQQQVFNALSHAYGVRAALDMTAGKEPYPSLSHFKHDTDAAFVRMGYELRSDIQGTAKTLGHPIKNLPTPEDYASGREFYEAMSDARAKMVNSGAKVAVAMGVRGKPVEATAKPAKTPEPAQLEAPPPPVEGRVATKRRGVERPYDIIDFIKENVGTIRSKSAAKPGTEGYYTPEFIALSKSGASRELFSKTGQSPDEVLETLRREGYIGPDADVGDLRVAIERANGQRRAIYRGETPEIRADKFQTALSKQAAKKSSHTVSVGDLGVGDKFKIGGEEFEVSSIDPDTGEVTVKDGRKFGYQTIPDGADIAIEKGSLDAKPRSADFGKEDFSLAPIESVEQQKLRLAHEEELAKQKAAQAKMEEGAAKPLIGSTGDIGQREMFGGGDLFSVGPGAASPSDVSAPGTIVSNMFAAIDRDRAELGKAPMEPGEPRTWDQDQQMATARMNRDPQWIPDLIKEVLDKPRPLLSWEQAGTVLQKAYWKAEANNALRRIANAVDSKLAEEELVRAKADAARFEDNLAQMEEAVGRGGTGSEAGRTLQAQKMGLNDDLTLIEMRLEARGKLGGRKLNEEESAKVEQIHEQYKKQLAALEKTAEEAEKRKVEAETRAALAEIGRQSAEAKIPAPHIQKLIDRVGQTIHERANAARERLKGKLFTLSPDVLKDLAEIGADNIWTIGEDFGRWSAKMVADIGERVRPHLQAVWEASKKLVTDTWDAQAGSKSKKPAPPKVVELAKQTIKAGDNLEQRRAKLTARIVDRAEKNQTDRIAPAVQKLARTFVQEGIHDREALIDAVHGVLEDAIPGWTRRQTMDAISGYGEYKSLSKDEISVRLRDLKGQMQQIAKLEDIASGEAPLRTGLERREVTKAQSELIKLVNEAKRKGGYETTDPARQLRTALDEVKKRTQTAIDDYQRRIAEGDYTVRKTTPITPDAELLNKQAALKRTRQQWEQQKRAWELGIRKGWQRALDKFVRWERFFKLSSPVVFGKLAGAAVTRVAETAATETVGGAMGILPGIRQVARQAPREGGLNVKAMAHGLVEAWRKGWQDAAQTLTKGAADIDVMYGEKLIDKDWANVMGQLHGMLKAPVKRFEYELALQKRTEHAIRTGQDPTNPLVSARLHTEALNDGYRSIFMQRGFSSDMFNQMVSQMEKSKKYPISGEVSARVLRFLMPVVRVPANIVAETATGIGGAPMASARTMFHAINGTLNKLDPVVADSIMRQFKKGSIGLGLMAIGYFSPQLVGGYDWREKRQPGAVKTGGFQIGGTDVPRWLTHAPWFELMQFGATIRHVKDQHVAKTGAEKGIGEGLWAAGLGLVEETPFVGQMLRVDKLFQSPAERTQYLGELAKSTLIPQVVIKAAELTDSGTQRKPTTILEHVKTGIPGLRSEVAPKPPPKATRSGRTRTQRLPLNP